MKEKKIWCELMPVECDKRCLTTGKCSHAGRLPKKKIDELE